MAGSGMVTDNQTMRTCNLAGLATMKGKETDLLKIRAAMIANIREADGATTYADVMRTALLGLQLTKATCDAALGIAGAVAEGPLKAIATVYAGATPMAEFAGKSMASGTFNKADAIKAANKSALAAVKMSKISNDMKDVVELKSIQTDIVVDAVNSDFDKIKRDMIALGEKMVKMSLNAIKQKSVSKIYDVTKQVYKAGQAYLTAYEEYRSNDMSGAMEGAKRTFRIYQGMIERQLLVLQREVGECETALYKQGVLSGDYFKPKAEDHLKRFTPSFPTIGPAR